MSCIYSHPHLVGKLLLSVSGLQASLKHVGASLGFTIGFGFEFLCLQYAVLPHSWRVHFLSQRWLLGLPSKGTAL